MADPNHQATPYSAILLAFLIPGMIIGSQVMNALAADWLPPPGKGFDPAQLLTSAAGGGIGGAAGGILGQLVATVFGVKRP